MEKVIVFTHVDLDGIGCAMLIKNGFPHTDIEYCVPDDINSRFMLFMERRLYEKYDNIFITDISVNKDIAELINGQLPEKCVLLDHHKTAEFLNEFSWAQVITESCIGKECGTHLVKNYLIKLERYSDTFSQFVELVRRYDTWEWKTRYKDERAKQLNDLFHIYGRERFVEEIGKRLGNLQSKLFNESEQLLLEMKEEQMKRYIARKSSILQYERILGYTAGIVFAEQYISELGNELAEMHPECDFIILIDMSSGIEYRCTKEEVSVARIAKEFGGGGHPKAAGSPIDKKKKIEIIKCLFRDR